MIRTMSLSARTAGASALATLALAATLTAAPGASATGRAPEQSLLSPGAACVFYDGNQLTFFGEQGERGFEVQCLLANRRYLPWSAVDGTFGTTTLAAVLRFQADHPPLVPDGLVGPQTWSALWHA
ncbi:peptidoglycan-binding protein [Streptomyces yanii]|uniref:Peptidoglycan-binding protein n=1 Tax=Streptomyces yanii TaxID=78510 RepID=A0ABV5R9Z4_9ACTN